MTGTVWNVSGKALEILCAKFWSNLEKKENPYDLCSFPFGVLTSVGISFTVYETGVIIGPTS